MLQLRAAEREARAWESHHQASAVSVPKSQHVHCPSPGKKASSEDDPRTRDSRRRLEHLEGMLALAKAWGDQEAEGEALYKLGEYFNSLGMLEAAYEYYERSAAVLFEFSQGAK